MFYSLKTIAEQLKIRLEYGPEFLGNPESIDVGLTPRHTIYQEGNRSLYCYRGQQENSQPILLVYSLINRPYIFDLRPQRSLIEYLTQNGFDVYLLDWGDPEPQHAVDGLEDLVAGTLHRCVRKVLRLTRQKSLTMLGYCMGGTFATLYAGLFPNHIEKLILLTTPLGVDEGSLLAKVARSVDWSAYQNASSLINGRELKHIFNMIRPAGAIKKERDFWKHFDQEGFLEHFLPVEKWGNDTPDLPGKAFHEYLQLTFNEEAFKQGQIQLGSRVSDLTQINCPVISVAAQHDWIIPASAVDTCKQVLPNAQHSSYILKGGHIGLVVGRQASQFWEWLINEIQSV